MLLPSGSAMKKRSVPAMGTVSLASRPHFAMAPRGLDVDYVDSGLAELRDQVDLLFPNPCQWPSFADAIARGCGGYTMNSLH